MNAVTTEKRPFYRKKRFVFGAVALLLALAVLTVGLVMVFSASPAVYRFGGAVLREDAYSYWFSCQKYVYQVRYRDLMIEDSDAGWTAVEATSGRSYGQLFREMIDEEIRLRFVAATLFDSEGYSLSDTDHETLDSLVEEFKTESFGEIPFEAIERTYGVGPRAVKQVALYEQKYIALYKQLFSDPSVVYSTTYREALESFYNTYYSRYNIIYLKDEAGADAIAALESSLGFDGSGVTEEEFTALEAEYTDESFKVTSGNYPHGIYLYAGESYARSFNDEILSAFRQADTVGKVVKVRNADGNGSYYVMRYALDKTPYLLDEEWVDVSFGNLPNYAGIYLYRTLLREELAAIESQGIDEKYTLPRAVSCKEYNIVQLLGNG